MTLGNANNPGIIIKKDNKGKSTFDIESVKLNLGEVNIGAAVVENLLLKYAKHDSGETIVQAGCTLVVSNSFETEADIELKKINGCWELDSMRFEFQILPPEEGIPIGATDIFLQGISGSVGNLTNTANLIIKAGVKLSDGIPYDVHANNPGFLMYLDGEATITKKWADFNVKLLLGAYYLKNVNSWNSDIGEADMDLYLDWTNGIYKLKGNLYIPTDYGVKVVGDIMLSENVKVFYGDVEIRIPTSWWLIGGKVLGDVGGAMMVFKNDKNASYAAGWTDFVIGCTCCHHWYCGGNWCACLLNAQVGLRYNFGTKSMSQIGAADIGNIKRQATSYFNAPPYNKNQNKSKMAVSKQTYAFEINVSDSTLGSMLMCKIKLNDSIQVRDVDIAVMGPSGLYDLDYYLYDTKAGYYHVNPDSMDYYTQKTDEVYFFLGDTFFEEKLNGNWQDAYNSEPRLIKLEYGQYEVIANLPVGIVPELESTVRHSNSLINITADYNNQFRDIGFSVQYWIPELPTVENGAKICIFTDKDSTGYNGRLISENPSLAEVRNNNIKTLNANWVPNGQGPNEKYYFYAMLVDSFHNQVFTPYTKGIAITPPIYGKFNNMLHPNQGVSDITVFLDLNKNGKLDLHKLPQKTQDGNVIPESDSTYVFDQTEPSCKTDSLGNFYFDINKSTNKLIDTGSYQLGFYLDSNIKVSDSSAVKRDDEILYTGDSVQLVIQIEEKPE